MKIKALRLVEEGGGRGREGQEQRRRKRRRQGKEGRGKLGGKSEKGKEE